MMTYLFVSGLSQIARQSATADTGTSQPARPAQPAASVVPPADQLVLSPERRRLGLQQVLDAGGLSFGAELGDLVMAYALAAERTYQNKVGDAWVATLWNGTVCAWGYAYDGGAPSAAIQARLTDVVSISSTMGAFAATRSDGTVCAWGDASYGGAPSAAIQARLTDVVSISSTSTTFTATRSDGSTVSWR